MRTRTRMAAGVAAVVALALLVSTQVWSQEKAKSQPPGEQPPADVMAKWMELNAKGPEHEHFKDMVGTWDTVSKMWMAPDAEPMVSNGTAEFRLLLDGRYVEQKYKCEGMMGPGSFEGIGIEGYDRLKKKYVSLWLDNTSTGFFITEGTPDESGKVVTYYGKMDDPITGQKNKVYKSIAREISHDKVVYEMYDTPPGGDEYKSMEITYTRKK